MTKRERQLRRRKARPGLTREYRRHRSAHNRREHPEQYLWRYAKMRAERDGLEFSIDVSSLVLPTHCPVLGLELFITGEGRTDHSPTLDRIDNKRGYIPGNVVVVSWRANRLKNDATLDEIRKLAAFYLDHPSVVE